MEPATPPHDPDTETTLISIRPRVSSSDILQGQACAEIEHAGQCYLLRVTRENKLILTK